MKPQHPIVNVLSIHRNTAPAAKQQLMKTPHPIVNTVQDLRDQIYRLAREWEAAEEEIEDLDAREALHLALSAGYPLGMDLDELVVELDTYAEHVEQVMSNQPTVLQLVADELGEDVRRVTEDAAERNADETADDAYRGWQNGGLGGEVGRVGGIFTPTVTSDLRMLMLAIDGGDPEQIQRNADRLARTYRHARRQSHT